MIAPLVNRLWQAASALDAGRFHRATRRVAPAQAVLLARCLAANRDTVYGRRHGFASIRSAADYQRRVPLTVYDSYAEEIDRIGRGEAGILTRQPVERFELSSGSTAASKLIPYTARLRAEFRRGLAPWIADLFAHYPELRGGPAYWSVTPLLESPAAAPGEVPIGFAADSDYLGPLGALIGSTLAVPDAVKRLHDMAAFRYVTLLHLLRAAELRLISVWNPTFLTLLLAPLADWWEPLLADLARGTVTPPAAIDPALRRRLEGRLAPAPERARALSRLGPGDPAALWRELRLISCWADGPAAPYAAELGRRFPRAAVQGKGLLATEAFVSLPLAGQAGAALAVTSHFFEFLADAGEPLLAHQLETGRAYAVVVTTGGGLYRYQLRDVVEVVGTLGEAPCLRFVGKTEQVSDWFGEKLDERFVAGVLDRLFARRGRRPSFAMVAPERCEAGLRYVLYLEPALELPLEPAAAPGRAEPAASADLGAELDGELAANFHYAYCRRLGQLAPPRVARVEGGQERYLRACVGRGQKLGNVKPAALEKAPGWTEWLGAEA